MSYSDHFGPLPKPIEFNIGTISVSPLPSYQAIHKEWSEASHRDGYFYPPAVHQVRIDRLAETVEPIPKTSRPAPVFGLPVTHVLAVSDEPDGDAPRIGTAGLVMYLLAYLFGSVVQFQNWRISGRVPVKTFDVAYFSTDEAAEFVWHATVTWRAWPPKVQNIFVNALYMHSRALAYQADWEEFMIRYAVLDALWNVASKVHCVQAKGHPQRWDALTKHFGLSHQPDDLSRIKELVKLRNDLFHEAQWGGTSPGYSPGNETSGAALHLRQFCERLIPAVVQFKTLFVQTSWTTRSLCKLVL